MHEKLSEIKQRFEIVSHELSQPETVKDQELYKSLSKEHSRLTPIVEKFDELLRVQGEREECSHILSSETDSGMRELCEAELCELFDKEERLAEEIKIMLLPRDENDDKNVIVEIRAGTGGDEAALFGAVLMRMYLRYAERHNFQVSVMSLNETEMGGIKEAVFSISGKGAYSRLKYENGVHRVQRVPETESSGRIHTSAATVVVLFEVEDVDIDIKPTDLRVDTYRSGGAGGQHVNTTDSAIRITHIPTGLVVQCQDERSQIKNRDAAMKVLKARLYDLEREKRTSQQASERKSAVGSGDRSERIRTYNFHQGRITDHRVNLTVYRLDAFLDGDMDEVIDALTIKTRMDMLASQS